VARRGPNVGGTAPPRSERAAACAAAGTAHFHERAADRSGIVFPRRRRSEPIELGHSYPERSIACVARLVACAVPWLCARAHMCRADVACLREQRTRKRLLFCHDAVGTSFYMASEATSSDSNASEHAELIRVRGVVQGVGFRPMVWRLAQRFGLRGW